MAKNQPNRTTPYYDQPSLGFKPKMLPYYYTMDNFTTAGMDTFTQFPNQDPEMWELLYNVLPSESGVFSPRWGYATFATVLSNANDKLSTYQNVSGNYRKIVQLAGAGGANIVYNEDGTVYRASLGTITAGASQRMVTSRDYGYFVSDGGGDKFKWSGAAASGTSNWGITAPTAPPMWSIGAAGAITLSVGRIYSVLYYNSTTGHYSDFAAQTFSGAAHNPVTGPVTASKIDLSGIPTSSDPQVDQRILLATADGGDTTTWYYLDTIADNVTTTYTDNTSEATLLANNIFQETDDSGNFIGVLDNTPPTSTSDRPIKHRGRLFMLDGQYVRYSKSIDELTTSTGVVAGRYEEAWPAEYLIDVSQGSEVLTSLFSDGESLWVGTNRHVRRVTGDSPSTFSTAEVFFNNVGVKNQDVMKPVFLDGQPIGVMWLTPDMRVIGSDFSTYRDVGHTIQPTLNGQNINIKWFAEYVSINGYNFWVLGNNVGSPGAFVYNLRTQRWIQWEWDTGNAVSPLYFLFYQKADGTPLMLMLAPSALLQWDTTTSNDVLNGVTAHPSIQLRTSWLDMGDPMLTKALNELDIITGAVTPTLLITLKGLTGSETAPTIVASATPTASPALSALKLYLAGYSTKYRYYQATITWTTTNSLESLGALNWHTCPITRF